MPKSLIDLCLFFSLIFAYACLANIALCDEKPASISIDLAFSNYLFFHDEMN